MSDENGVNDEEHAANVTVDNDEQTVNVTAANEEHAGNANASASCTPPKPPDINDPPLNAWAYDALGFCMFFVASSTSS